MEASTAIDPKRVVNLKHNANQFNTQRLGIILVVIGLSVAALTAALMKLLAEQINPYQITWFRFLGFAIILFPVVLLRFGVSALKPKRPGIQLIRGLTMSSATVCFVAGSLTIDFADAVAILYAYPFLLVVIAVFFLNEKVRWTGWVAVLGGFLGVLLVIRPEINEISIGTVLVFICAVIVSVQMALNRKLGLLSHPLITGFWGATIAAVSLSLILPFYWQPVNAEQFTLLCLVIICGAVNQTCLVFAFAKAEASVLAPFTYLEIVSAVILGLLFFDTWPVLLSWAGIVLIILSGILVARVSS